MGRQHHLRMLRSAFAWALGLLWPKTGSLGPNSEERGFGLRKFRETNFSTFGCIGLYVA